MIIGEDTEVEVGPPQPGLSNKCPLADGVQGHPDRADPNDHLGVRRSADLHEPLEGRPAGLSDPGPGQEFIVPEAGLEGVDLLAAVDHIVDVPQAVDVRGSDLP